MSDAMADQPLLVYFDGACPVCSLEIGALRARDRCGALAPIDISAPGFDAAGHGFELRALDAEMHAIRPDGTVLRGMAALRALYAAVGLGAWLAPTGWPLLRPVFDAAYRAFARYRRALPRLERRGARGTP